MHIFYITQRVEKCYNSNDAIPLFESKLRVDEYQTLAIETEFPQNHSVFYIAIIIIYTIENGTCMQCIFTLSQMW